ncbi:tetratricopeptide repeat protein [Herbivorax sp. ANBcel31]|uniref:tetratricopeptide repeat protein n=1 Tax=Herbivorax sp. ANBcel31 TaxID=3069754 RepID=UPI0027AF9130|nr:tetratricopeptide repeat protein [Herbivorax sp. ANBcel31]MDQ2085082.1 tetratricopeptide repeat protein [Herbivorax sp. ANBcel31]
MDIWSILGIEKTNDKRQIKKAYVKMLKKYHPEDDADGFIVLKNAYDEALKQSDSINDKNFNKGLSFDEKNKELLENQERKTLFVEKEDNYKNISYEKSEKDVFGKLQILYNDIFKRRDIECWRKLFLELSIDEYIILCQRGWIFLNNNFHLTWEVWKLLDEELRLCNNSNFKWVNLVNYDFGLNFDYLDKKHHCDYNRYVSLRFEAFNSLRSMDYQSSLKHAEDAYEIYDKDPVLHKITGISYYMLNNNLKANEFFSKALFIDNEDLKSLIYIGHIFFKKGDYTKAIKEFKLALEIDSDNIEAAKGLIKCFDKLKKKKAANIYIVELKEKGIVDLELDIIFYKYQLSNPLTKVRKLLKVLNYVLDRDKPIRILIDMILMSLLLFIPVILALVFRSIFLTYFFLILILNIFVIMPIYKKIKG